MTDRSFRRGFEVLDLAFPPLRQAATSAGVTLNDVFLTAVVRGLKQYHNDHGVNLDRLRVLMPVSTRAGHDAVVGNYFVPARFIVAAPNDAAECLRGVQRIADSWKHAPSLGVSDLVATGLNLLPAPAVVTLWGSMLRGDDVCITNVPGPPFQTYLAGARVERIYAFAPPSGAALNVALITQEDHASVGICVDTAAIPDSGQVMACLAMGFDETTHLGHSQTKE